MSFTVLFTPTAEAQAERARQWWTMHRPTSPDLLVDELAAAIQFLSATPTAAPEVAVGRRRMRRHFLAATRYHLYFEINEPEQQVIVKAVWSAHRGRRPAIRGR
jgi:hypothetical protein